MTIITPSSENIRRMTAAQRSAITSGMIAAQNRQQARPPAAADLAQAYWSGFVAGGGRLPARIAPAPEKPKRIIAPKHGAVDLLREQLETVSGRKLIAWATDQALAELARTRGGRLSARLVWELARSRYAGSGMSGEWKVDNRVSAGWARWFLWAYPEYAGRIELRGPDSRLYLEGRVTPPWWFDPDSPYVPRPMSF